jgi:hypothetical protein
LKVGFYSSQDSIPIMRNFIFLLGVIGIDFTSSAEESKMLIEKHHLLFLKKAA